jgi:adenosylcobinamide kinase/adenosylcobinamide-phosphate guanylyltransferase
MILIGGGSRSGKSAAALRMLKASGPRQGFIATAQPWDDEMRHRIERHKAEREPEITAWEEPFAVAERIASVGHDYDAIVVDCLTLWLSNHMLSEHNDVPAACRTLIAAAAESPAQIILVTNEVGTGIVPENALARRFRDEQGRLNQLAAEHATGVYFMTFGIAARLK